MLRVVTGAASVAGGCGYQEDRYAIAATEDAEWTLLCVFDGHAGFKASEYARKHLPRHVFRRLPQQPPAQALVDAFKDTDAEFLRKLEDCGSTAVVALVSASQRSLWVANAGDSRAILVLRPSSEASDAATFVALSRDHKPSDPAERARIEAAGHEVVDDATAVVDGRRVHVARVDGLIACARGLGDGDLKDFGVAPEAQAITCVPDVAAHGPMAPGGREACVVLACDGLWDVASSGDVAAFVAQRLPPRPAPERVAEVAALLVNRAVDELGSDDNTTAVIGAFVWD